MYKTFIFSAFGNTENLTLGVFNESFCIVIPCITRFNKLTKNRLVADNLCVVLGVNCSRHCLSNKLEVFASTRFIVSAALNKLFDKGYNIYVL